ncbi:hypothetical protein Tcan_07011 [Toxocara canis]|uniref:Protein Lines N-terminal domain-containing protein n=1 Tax=Toxocara canis TaxID=6265 RepID=A0A0B2VZD1_TOXCA|nr:hypothetical protein Tcan_07011 [Toxocara canis]
MESSSKQDGEEDMNLLRELVVWKRRLYADDSTIESFECSDELCDESLFCVQDSVCRRSLLFVIGKLVKLCWESSDFGRKPLNPTSSHFIHRLFALLNQIVDRIEFDNGDIWFGGIIPKASSSQRAAPVRNSIQFVSICIHVAALLVGSIPSDALSHLLHSLVRFYDSCAALACSLIEHDERCVSCAVALQHLDSSHIVMPTQFDVATLFCSIIYQIAFDHSVIIDWLQSELATVPFLLRFLKDIYSNLERYKKAARNVNREKIEEEPQIFFDPQSVVESADNTVITISQLHGEQKVTSKYTFSKSGKAYSVMEASSLDAARGECSMERIMQCFSQLRNSCERLQRSQYTRDDRIRVTGCFHLKRSNRQTLLVTISHKMNAVIVDGVIAIFYAHKWCA